MALLPLDMNNTSRGEVSDDEAVEQHDVGQRQDGQAHTAARVREQRHLLAVQ